MARRWRLVLVVGLLVLAAPAGANTGIDFVMGMTPFDVGLAYTLAIWLTEAVVVARVCGVGRKQALKASFVANLVSAVMGYLLTAMPFILLLADPLQRVLGRLTGQPWHPVLYILGLTLGYFVASVLVEGLVYSGSKLVDERPWRAAWAGNAVTYLLTFIVLLSMPKTFRYYSSLSYHNHGQFLMRQAFRDYQQAHQGQLPPESDDPMAVTHALQPYFRGESSAFYNNGRTWFYDRFRWRGDWPEVPLTVGGRSGRSPWVTIDRDLLWRGVRPGRWGTP